MTTKHPKNSFQKPAISLAILLVMLISCNLPSRLATTATPQLPTASPSPAPLDTPTPLPPTPTATAAPPPEPTSTATPSTTNIIFATGTTAAVLQGSLQSNQVKIFTLSAEQYQPMILILTSTFNDVFLGVNGPDGSKLLDPANKWTSWQWLLPKTGLYTIQIVGGAASANYTLTAKVAKRVTFASGTSSITLSDRTEKGYVFSYALRCQANQTMTVSLNVPASTAYLDVFGLATGTLVKSSVKATTWTGILPSTQDYIIEIIPANGQVVDYSLQVIVH
jgi:hypothetical protein